MKIRLEVEPLGNATQRLERERASAQTERNYRYMVYRSADNSPFTSLGRLGYTAVRLAYAEYRLSQVRGIDPAQQVWLRIGPIKLPIPELSRALPV